MALLEVTVSGTVGKQTVPTTSLAELKGFIASPSGANMTVKIRDGNASGEVVYFGRHLSAFGAKDIEFRHKFTKGMHVKVIGTNAAVYLILE